MHATNQNCISVSLDTIRIEKLLITCIIGMLPEERINPQRLYVDMELYADFSDVIKSDNVEDTINYAEVADLVQETAINTKAKMVEYLAGVIIEKLKNQYSPKLNGVKIRLSKPDILPNTDSVGIELTRMFNE